MKGKFVSLLTLIVILSIVASTILVGCATKEAEPTEEAEPLPAVKAVNRAGVELPDDAAPIEEQVLRLAGTEYSWLSWSYTAYDFTGGPTYGIHDSCVRPDKEFMPQPSGCESWEVSDDGLTWTFH